MAVLAVCIPPVMLGVVLALGRYEELLLPPARNPDETDGARRHARHARHAA
ncbi:hypothetical protein KY5_6864 [Streptomyces formicae]|uniref:Uncharacterized protein n=1 Tax=Streptomyces formicae TaxID=1616117 RepID=A0A291QJX9_9ACTN|nr:hypothetical protein KY5_6864 [Streptomyces formicae]